MLGEFNKWAEFKKLETGINLLFPSHFEMSFRIYIERLRDTVAYLLLDIV